MSLYQVNVPSAEEASQLQIAEQQITDALDSFFRQMIERRSLEPFDTTMYARMLNALVSMVLKQCFAVEHGENEDLYRERLIELIERLFFGPPLSPLSSNVE
jgi:hypothetical protein